MVVRRFSNSSVIASAAFCVICLMFAGCGDGKIPTKGTVKVDGKPLTTGGKVTFYPTDGGRPGSGSIRDDGTFLISVDSSGDGLPPGNYKVTIVANVVDKTKKAPKETPEDLTDRLHGDLLDGPSRQSDDVVRYIVPIEYSRLKTTPLKHTIAAGDDKPIDFDIKSEE